MLPHISLKFKEPPFPVAPRKEIKGILLDTEQGDTVHLRIALWEGNGNVQRLTSFALLADELK